MRQIHASVKTIRRIQKDIYLLSFVSPHIARSAVPGQFLHIKPRSPVLLRRPLSIHRVHNNEVCILFRIRGQGTRVLSQYKRGDTVDILGPLGKGFGYAHHNMQKALRILIAGGMGVAPLLFLGEQLRKLQTSALRLRSGFGISKAKLSKSSSSSALKKSTQRSQNIRIQNVVLLGAKTKKDILCKREFKKLGFTVAVATEDGSGGLKGTAVDLLYNTLSNIRYKPFISIYTCGPSEMFSQIAKVQQRFPTIDCEVSFEQFMGCGVGLCHACVVKTRDGYKRVCKDGPVFNIREIVF